MIRSYRTTCIIFKDPDREMSAPGFSSVPQAGISSSYGNASPIKLQYAELVSISLASNEVNLVDAAAYGHRVQSSVPYDTLNNIFLWSRAVGALSPTVTIDYTALASALSSAVIANGFNDLDSNANGLSFTSSSLSDTADPRYRATAGTYTWNDIVLAYVLYKLYGKTSYPTLDNVFNMEDVSGMVINSDVYDGILTSMQNHNDKVVKMFRDLISSDPQRFFDASGKQVPGIFETNADVSGTGSWNFTEGDLIEIRIEFTFASAISRRDITEVQIDTNTEPSATRHIAAGEKFAIRWQIVAGAASSGGSGGGSGGTPYVWKYEDIGLLWRNARYVVNQLLVWRNAQLASGILMGAGGPNDFFIIMTINSSIDAFVYSISHVEALAQLFQNSPFLASFETNPKREADLLIRKVNETFRNMLNPIIINNGLSIPLFPSPESCTTNPGFAGQA